MLRLCRPLLPWEEDAAYQRIAYEVIKLAVNEAQHKGGRGPSARYFLRSAWCRELLDNLLLAWGLQEEWDAKELLKDLWRAE